MPRLDWQDVKQIILNFHGVGEPPPGTDLSDGAYWWEQNAFNCLLDQICAARRNCSIPIAITFDDGNISDARVVLPALVKRGLSARFFICAGRIGRANYLDKLAIADLISADMIIGSHGMNHVDWRRATASELETETAVARQVLEDVCGCRIEEAGIPFGSYDRRVIATLRQQGWKSAYTSDGGYAFEDAWLKPRNSLQGSWQGRNVSAPFNGEGAWGECIRWAIKLYKRVR